MRVVIMEPDVATRDRLKTSLEIVALSEGKEAEISVPGMEAWGSLLRHGEPPDVILCRPHETDFVDSLRRIVKRAGAAPVCVLSGELSASLRIEARRLGAEWIPRGAEIDAREVWRRLRGAAAYSQSRPEIERRTLAAIVMALEEVREALDVLAKPQPRRRGPLGRGCARLLGLLDAGTVKILVWIAAGIITLAGAAVGIDIGFPGLTKPAVETSEDVDESFPLDEVTDEPPKETDPDDLGTP